MQLAAPEGEEVPDAWHHQLVFMTNPLDVVSEGEAHRRLCSESLLLIRREDVLQRLAPDCRLSGLPDQRWRALDVEGQVRRMRLEEERERGGAKLTHIAIPAAYGSGVTFFALRRSQSGRELLGAPELPLL